MKLSYLINGLLNTVLYRAPLHVTESRFYYHDGSYPVCPRCRSTLPRAYMRYCDRCGQCLSWNRFYMPKEDA